MHLLWIISIEQRVVLRAGVKPDFSMKLKHYNMNTLILFEVETDGLALGSDER